MTRQGSRGDRSDGSERARSEEEPGAHSGRESRARDRSIPGTASAREGYQTEGGTARGEALDGVETPRGTAERQRREQEKEDKREDRKRRDGT